MIDNNFNKELSNANKELKNMEANINKINSSFKKSSFFNDFNISKNIFDDFNEGSEEAVSSIQNIEISVNSLENSINNISIKDFTNSIKDSLSTVSSIYKDLSSSFTDFFTYDLSSYDNAIEEAKNKLKEFDDYQRELKENKKLEDDEDFENYLNRLDEELELAINNKYLMSAEAIRIKQEELKKKQNKEKEDLQKEKEIKAQRELLEKELAQAEYNKSYADWTNKVKLAEMEKSKAIADAVLIPSIAIAQSALGVSSSFAQGGPIGFAAGLAISATVISSAISAASGIMSAANALDSVKSNPPIAPQFAFGTTGYNIPDGGSVIVGEMGAEVVSNNAGKISVQSNAQLNESAYSKGDIWNITINVEHALDPDEVYKLMNSYKARNSQKYSR